MKKNRLTWLYGIVVFSKSWCPYCKASKSLLSELGAKFTTFELDQIGMASFTLLISFRSLFQFVHLSLCHPPPSRPRVLAAHNPLYPCFDPCFDPW